MSYGNGGSRSILFGSPAQIGVERALAEFRGGRPIKIKADGREVVALPVEGLTDARLAEFKSLCTPMPPRLVISASRARALGVESAGDVALMLRHDVTAASLHALATDPDPTRGFCGDAAAAAETAAIELIKLAQGLPAVLTADACTAALGPEPAMIAIEAEAVASYRRSLISSLAIASEARVPIASGVATRFVVFRDSTGGSNSVAVIIGTPDLSAPVPVRLHSACLTGDVFGSRRCDCGDQLRLGIEQLEAAGGGVVLYLAQEGRGLGLVNKMRAYRLQDTGLDTIDANTTLGFDDDERDYGIAARMLELLGIASVWLLTNNPAKLEGLRKAGIIIAGRRPLQAPVNPDNRRYLTAKAARAGHHLDHLIAALSSGGVTDPELAGGRAASTIGVKAATDI